ncbi:hypothetical protein AN639_02110 [Candidatus Epulonipiscium fishelsonii]|uniref:Uncharacterized protein n=1 Tax=Candidatus Epulonipiscium fishelsonii TaxID=77094 RepID=A0ACC8XFU0_9FIRM|nr:hypothetical protein AN396_02265 [Epulopiscium sp. SCG-B11WGA-EpuloA1]ONI43415.1 hypothetical protein AN639_02110 [Epulopiscium sp. SCG-B05WGA-EpuloA1]ONI48382.1 hypothetical protein AN643_01710 [Epulopiscium sp. SCG-B10WGA-EpuloB]
MLLLLLVDLFLSLFDILIVFFPSVIIDFDVGSTAFETSLMYALYFFSDDFWLICILNISFWLTSQMVFAICFFVYKRIIFR